MGTGKMRHAQSALWAGIRASAGKFSNRFPAIWDGVSKVAIPIGAAIVAVAGHNIQLSIANTQQLVQRDEADTRIRAEMFKATTDPLFKSVKNPLSPSEQAVFAELLALNFHEHIELKPLLLDVDAKLDTDSAALQARVRRLPGKAREQPVMLQIESRQLDDRLRELRSGARRVRSRQTAMLAGEQRPEIRPWWKFWSAAHTDNGLDENRGKIRYVGVRRKSACGVEDETLDTCGVQPTEGKNICTEELVRESAPDGKSFVVLTVREKTSDFRQQRFGVGFKDQTLSAVDVEARADDADSKRAAETKNDPIPKGAIIPSGASMTEFQVTWFDFPLTDNTLLESGARFAIFIDQICQRSPDAEEVDAVRLGLLWFPRDYYPARDRPTSYRQLRERLNLGT